MRGKFTIAAGAVIGLGAVASAQDGAQDRAQIEAGDALYEQHCSSCHGEKLRSAGAMPDLRELPANARQHFDTMVLDGQGQMPAWRGQLSAPEIDQIWTYIRSRAR